ncbi:MAG: hypothetical protein V1873_04680 [Verrucomicrobiota bacterium]
MKRVLLIALAGAVGVGLLTSGCKSMCCKGGAAKEPGCCALRKAGVAKTSPTCDKPADSNKGCRTE